MREALIKFFTAIAAALGGNTAFDREVNAESENAVANKAIFAFVKKEIQTAFFVDERSEAI